jgi:hypothetical protein
VPLALHQRAERLCFNGPRPGIDLSTFIRRTYHHFLRRILTEPPKDPCPPDTPQMGVCPKDGIHERSCTGGGTGISLLIACRVQSIWDTAGGESVAARSVVDAHRIALVLLAVSTRLIS